MDQALDDFGVTRSAGGLVQKKILAARLSCLAPRPRSKEENKESNKRQRGMKICCAPQS